jgi:hypothetical protein
VTFLATEEQETLAKPENAWVTTTARIVQNLVTPKGSHPQQKPQARLYCSDECTLAAIKLGLLNVPEPKRIVPLAGASADAVQAAAQAAERARQATEALKAGGPVTLG